MKEGNPDSFGKIFDSNQKLIWEGEFKDGNKINGEGEKLFEKHKNDFK